MLSQIADGRTDLVIDHLAAGLSAKATDQHGTRIIHWCAYHGDVTGIRVLLEKGESLASLGVNFDLNGAAFHGHWQLCQFLIENGADVDFRLADTGETPLHAALCKANRPVYDHVIEILLAAGADPNVATLANADTGAFMRACRTKEETPLHRAAAFGTQRAVDMLLEAGADRRAKDMNGDSPLTWASWHLRPASILKALCYDDHRMHSDNQSTYDHGCGWNQIDPPMRGRPHVNR